MTCGDWLVLALCIGCLITFLLWSVWSFRNRRPGTLAVRAKPAPRQRWRPHHERTHTPEFRTSLDIPRRSEVLLASGIGLLAFIAVLILFFVIHDWNAGPAIPAVAPDRFQSIESATHARDQSLSLTMAGLFIALLLFGISRVLHWWAMAASRAAAARPAAAHQLPEEITADAKRSRKHKILERISRIVAACSFASGVAAGINDFFDLRGHLFPLAEPPATVQFELISPASRLECHRQQGDWLLAPFEDARSDRLEGPNGQAVLNNRIALILQQIQREEARRHVVSGFLLIGSTDQRDLSARAANFFHSNAEIAEQRAEYVKSVIESDRLWHMQMPPTIITIPRGAEIIGPRTNAQTEAVDRSVQLCVFLN